jgi:thioredoxin-like negative regulator of GroEL
MPSHCLSSSGPNVRARHDAWRASSPTLLGRSETRLRVMRVDIEEQPELAERFGVPTVPALVLVKEKRIVDRIDGRASAPKIEHMLASHLAVAIA